MDKKAKAPKRVDKVLSDFGDNVLTYRKKAELTQEELAGAIGLSRVMIANIEAGINRTTIEHILRICAVLKVTPNDLFPAVPDVTVKTVIVSRRVVEKKSLKANYKW